MSKIFKDAAPLYWDAGLPVIPLWEGQKRPAILDWSKFCQVMPEEGDKELWLHQFPTGNIGLPLGPASGLVALDIDTTDQEIIRTIEEMIPNPSPWKRIGAKGYVAMFRFTGEKTFSIKTMENKTICELLANGRQVVLPPSIHPDTKLPYTANCELLEVFKHVPRLPDDFERQLRAALAVKNVKLSVSGFSRVTEWVPQSSRDLKYTSVCGMYASDVIKGRITLVEAIHAVEAWPETFTEQVMGDNLDPKDGVRKLVKFMIKSVRNDHMILRKGWDKGLSEQDKIDLGLDFDEDEQERNYEQILELLQADLQNAKDMSERGIAVSNALTRIKRSPSLSKIQEEQLLKAIGQFSNMKNSLSVLRKELSKMRNLGLSGDSHAEIAEDMKEKRDEIRFDNGQFWRWEGAYWVVEPEEDLQAYVVNHYGNLPVCKRDGEYKAVVRTFSTICKRPLADTPTAGINFSNGFLTSDGVLHAHSPAFGMTYCLPYPYLKGKETEAPRFFSFLRDAWGQDEDYKEKVQALQEAIAATMFGITTKMNRAFLLYGVAHSGKSVLLRIIEGLLPPDRVSAIPPNQWGDKFSPAQLANKLLNIGGELHEKQKIDGQIFKQIVVGETISGQHKGKQIFRFNPTCAHWFASNYLPQSDDMSEGFLRRWLFLTFPKKFPEGKRNINLADDIVAEEREAICAWAVSAIYELQKKNCYTLPSSHETRVRELLAGQDSIYFFLQAGQRIQVTPCPGEVGQIGSWKSAAISAQTVYGEYHTFTSSMAARPVTFPSFVAKMRQLASLLGFEETMQSSETGFPVTGYAGLTLVTAQKGH